MGTRADFYVGRGKDAEWLGSIGWDGYPDGINDRVLKADSDDGFRKAVKDFFANREDATLPEEGWPWPWDDSTTTDYAYAFDDGSVHASCFGHAWFDPTKKNEDGDESDCKVEFPNMKKRKNVQLGAKSGLITLGG